MRYVVHIGMHKTGSTAFQALLARHPDALARQGVDFPVIGANIGAKRHYALNARLKANPADPELTALLAIAPSGIARRILSCEGFCPLPVDAIARMRAALDGEARTIAIVRDPCTHIVSFYKERLRLTGAPRDLPAFVASHTRRLRDDPDPYYGYDAMAARWRGAMGDLTLLPYRRETLVADLLAATEIALPTDPPASDRSGNPSLGDAAACIMARVATLAVAGRMSPERREAVWVQLAGADRALVDGFADAIERAPLALDTFFAAFRRASPRAAEAFGFAPPAGPLDWPRAVLLDDDAFLARLAALRIPD